MASPQHDLLPGSEPQTPVDHGDRLRRADHRRAEMRVCVGVAVSPVVFVVLVGRDEPFQQLAEVRDAWLARMKPLLSEATLERPIDRPYTWFGKRGQHSEHLGYMLAEMQHLQRAHPGARW